MNFFEKATIEQQDVLEWVKNHWGSELMVPIHGYKRANGKMMRISAIMVPVRMETQALKFDYGSFCLSPGFCEDGEELRYARFGNFDGIEPLVFIRTFYGLKKSQIEILEDFRLLFNLYYDSTVDKFICLKDNSIVVETDENGFVYFNRKFLRRYLAARSCVLVMELATTVDGCEVWNENKEAQEINDLTSVYQIRYGASTIEGMNIPFSHMNAKKIVNGCNIKDCDVSPFLKEKEYEEFIIGLDEEDNNVLHTCNPEKLNDYYGKNPSAPLYLTPIYFKRGVLGKYYAEPSRYKVEDSRLVCGDLWDLPIDNQSRDIVSAYLGDIGMCLDKSEQSYWKGFNVACEKGLSRTKILRDVYAVFTSPEAPDLVFRNMYEKVNSEYDAQIGWPLFRPFHDDDMYCLALLRIPLSEDVNEFDNNVLYLTKSIIDSLNERQLERFISAEDIPTQGIAKLESFLKSMMCLDYEEHIEFLRGLQSLRSKSVAHNKSSSYEKSKVRLGIENLPYSEAFSLLLRKGTSFLEYMQHALPTIRTQLKC